MQILARLKHCCLASCFFKTLADSMVFAIANQKVAFAARLGAIGNKRLKHQNQTLNSWSTSMYTKQPGWNTFNCAAQQHVELTQWPYGAAGASCGLNHWSTMCWKLEYGSLYSSSWTNRWLEILGPCCSYTSAKNWAWEQNTMVINLQWFFNLQWSSIWIQILSAPGDTSVVVHQGMNFSSVSSIGPSAEGMVVWPCGWLVPEPKKC